MQLQTNSQKNNTKQCVRYEYLSAKEHFTNKKKR